MIFQKTKIIFTDIFDSGQYKLILKEEKRSQKQETQNKMIKFNQTIFIDIISLLVVILELVLLVNIFPQTGLSRIIYIPFWIIVCFM